MLNSPLTLEVLLHCYYSPAPHPKRNIEVYREAFDYLQRRGMIEQRDAIWVATPKGKFFVEHILALPFPEITFVVPGISLPTDEVA